MPNAVTSRAALAAAAGAAQVRSRGAPEGASAVRRLQRHGARQGAAPADVARADLRAGRRWAATAWGAARALFAAGFRAGDVVHNSFSYHLTPGGFILESGAHALGCAVIPAGTGNTEQQLEAIAHFKPDRLSRHAGFPEDPARHGGRSRQGRLLAASAGWSPAPRCRRSLRQELSQRGVDVLQCYATAELGVIAYESEAREGMIVNETLLRRDRAARHRRSGCRRRGRRGGRHLVQSRTIR